ncbi:MAG: ADP-ribosylglycohydrolase family protein [Peptococcaceae bacterium]|nr:ADP-ribosylglycohydrolase family protein [Peptococcaceae bacterium]
MKRDQAHFRGCLLGGAIGDALGWPVEFQSLAHIKQKYGSAGITTLDLGGKQVAEFTDDTQMTLFTAEGLLRAETRYRHKGICHPPAVVYYAYLRWLHTQGYPRLEDKDFIYDGWLIGVKQLNTRRAPGNTCLSALSSGRFGSMEEPINDSKGCGGVMRVAPVGLLARKDQAFHLAAECAALTHGHPSGYLSAGVLAHVVACLIEGLELEAAVQDALVMIGSYKGSQECVAAITKAIELAGQDLDATAAIRELGEGWVGEEAIAIALYCALKYKTDFNKALCAAVNHDGDSDSTGAITGNILGAYLGLAGIPAEWVSEVEMQDILIQVADDLLIGYEKGEEWWKRYPGY